MLEPLNYSNLALLVSLTGFFQFASSQTNNLTSSSSVSPPLNNLSPKGANTHCIPNTPELCPSFSNLSLPLSFTLYGTQYATTSQALNLGFNSNFNTPADIYNQLSKFGCYSFNITNPDLQNLRFRKTIGCYDLLTSTSPISSPCLLTQSKPNKLCKSTCQEYYQAFLSTINDPQHCDAKISKPMWDKKLAECFDESSNSTCVDGTDNEKNTCGYNTIYQRSQICFLCSDKKSDPCCASVNITALCPNISPVQEPSLPIVQRSKLNDPIFITSVVLMVLSTLLALYATYRYYQINKTLSVCQQEKIPENLSHRGLASTTSLPQTPYSNDTSFNSHSDATLMNSYFQPKSSKLLTVPSPTGSQLPLIPSQEKIEDITKSINRMVAICHYQPNLPDEITLYVNDTIEIQHQFDDGWAIGKNVTSGKTGAFPRVCLGAIDDATSSIRNSNDYFDVTSKHGSPASSRSGREFNASQVATKITRRTSSQRTSRYLP